MKQTDFYFINNNRGSTIILALLMIVALSLTVFMAVDTSTMNSSMMRNNREYRDDLYRSESGISIAAENYRTVWLDSASILFDQTNNDADILNQDADLLDTGGVWVTVARYDIARIEDYTDATVNGFLDADALTREFYPVPHIGPPSIGSGTSPKNFEIRRYGIHSRAVDRQGDPKTLTVESGLHKLFNKFT